MSKAVIEFRIFAAEARAIARSSISERIEERIALAAQDGRTWIQVEDDDALTWEVTSDLRARGFHVYPWEGGTRISWRESAP